MKIRVGKYDLETYVKNDVLLIYSIKTTRQRKYRSLQEFYEEVNNIKVNEIDKLLRGYSRREKSLEERLSEQNKMLEELGINKEEIIEAYREKYIETIKNKKFY